MLYRFISLFSVVAAAFVTPIVLPAADARAQEPIAPQTAVTTGARPASLTEALRTLPFRWDVREKGVLLWVGINPAAEPARLRKRSDFEMMQAPGLLQPWSNGYRLQDIAAYFDRRVVSVGSVTVLTPTFTTVLATRLPEPDIYADLTTSEKLRRLESTLSPAQWRLLGSPNGLGEGDLKSSQKSIWASLLPDPLSLIRRRNDNGMVTSYSSSSTPTPLTPSQKAGIRLTLYRTLSWLFRTTETTEPYGRPGQLTYVGTPASGPDGTETLLIRDDNPSSTSWYDPETALFGATVKQVVPVAASLKPSQIAYESATLDPFVSLKDAKTVGELVARVREKTGTPLFCDPRYQTLSFGTVGGEIQSVRAGDLLSALAQGVAGTFRRVSDETEVAYLLTDDAEGLGTRQARINEWAQEAATRRAQADALVEAALAKVRIGDYVDWRETDLNAPTGDLNRRIEAYRTGTSPLPKSTSSGSGDPNTGLWVSVGDLPVAVQNTIKAQELSWNVSMDEEAKRTDLPDVFRYHRAPLRTDRVQLTMQTGMAFLIPGVGRVEMGNTSGNNSPQELLPAPVYRQPRVSPLPRAAAAPDGVRQNPAMAENPAPFRLEQVGSGGAVRALLVSVPPTAEAANDVVSAAKAGGFTELWVEVPPLASGGKTSELLMPAIAVAKAQGLRVEAVVRVSRPLAAAVPELPRERNLLGETMTEWASRRAAAQPSDAQEVSGTGFSHEDYVARLRKNDRQNALRQKTWGDYLDVSSPTTEAAISADLAALSQTPGLAGVVVRDTAPPGSGGNGLPLDFTGVQSIAAQFGYTPAQRLRFLRQTGIDPVDLSPLSDGRLALPSGTGAWRGMPPGVGLPQLPDYGPNAGTTTINGISAITLGAKNGWALWNTFRWEQGEAFWKRLQKRYAAQAPSGVPLLCMSDDPWPINGGAARLSCTGTWDKKAPPVAGQRGMRPPARPTPEAQAAAYLDRARQTSSRVLLTFHYDPVRESSGFSAAMAALLRPYQNQSGWDGFVLDLSLAPPQTVLPLLRGLPKENH